MFQCGDQVIYGIHGVCTVAALEKQLVNRKYVEYYVLTPAEQAGAKYYVPTQNETAVAKMRRILSREEITELLHSDAVRKDAWIEDEGQRKQNYRDLIVSGDRVALLQMVHTLHQHRQQILDSGRKFHQCDENFLRDAEKLLSSEFSLVLDLDTKATAEYIKDAIQNR